MPDSEDELFQILDQYMNLEPEKLPSREEIETQYPALASEIWRCLEGMKLLKNEDATRQTRLSAFTVSSEPMNPNFGDSTGSFSESVTQGMKKPEITLGLEPIGDFELIREIARGGMGVVYEAWQNSLKRTVALKILPLASTFDERQLQRFRNEASAAAQLEHSGIVPIYAIGCERGIHFYAMKLINGQPLGNLIHFLRGDSEQIQEFSAGKEDSVKTVKFMGNTKVSETLECMEGSENSSSVSGTTQENRVSQTVEVLYTKHRSEYIYMAARLMKQAADALDYAHQCGVIHRDIKPANLMLDVEGKLWITDFGLAQVRSDVHLTRTGEVFGTPRYMSPEQAQGKNRLADHRVDVYSLGATFYEWLTLHPIFSETNQVQLLKQITQEEPKRLRMWDSSIPRDLETILLKCLAKQPTDRYESASELSADLERFLENRPIKARRPGVLELATKWNYRHPWFLLLALLVFASLWLGTAINHHLLVKEKSRTQQALGEAQARFEKARTAADKLVKIAEEELAGENSPSIRRARQKVLDTALVLYQDFLKIDELDPQTEQQLTAIRNYVQQFMELLAETDGLPPIFLLTNRDVQQDLDLAELQKKQIWNFNQEFREKGELIFRDSRNFTPEERVQRMTAQIRETDSFLNEVLTEKQKTRLRQIQLQIQPERLLDESVQNTLKLTVEQVAKIESLLSVPAHEGMRNFRPGREPGTPHGPGVPPQPETQVPPDPGKNPELGLNPSPPPRPRFMESNGMEPPEIPLPPGPEHFPQNTQQKQIESILTPEQLKNWQEMKGEEFKRSPHPPPERNELQGRRRRHL